MSSQRIKTIAATLVVLVCRLSDAQAGQGDVLRFGIDASDLGTGDPHHAASRNDRAVADMVFNGLLRYVPGNAPAIEPDLALTIPYPVLADGKQNWVFNLRKDVYCHPGPETSPYQLNADDVVYSLQRAADAKRSAYAGDYNGMTFSKVDDFTVKVSLKSPLSSILFFPKMANYAGGLIVCRKAVEAMGDDKFAAHPVGTGPYVFSSHQPGTKVELTGNSRYFRGTPLLSKVEVRYLSSFEERIRALHEGELDVIFGSEKGEWLSSMTNEDSLKTDVFGVGQVVCIHFNTSIKPLDDVRVRKAIALGIDRNRFLSLFAKGVVENTWSPVPIDFLPGGLSESEVKALGLDYPYDPDQARMLLTAAGYGDGFSLKLVTSKRDHYVVNYESLRDQLSKLNIDLDLEVVEHRNMHARIRQDENGLVIYVAWRPNADAFLTRFFHSDSTVVSGVSPDTNFSHYDKIDSLIEAARQAREPADQVRFWKQAQVRLLDDAIAYPLHYVNLVYARRANVDYGHELKATMALYPQFTEATHLRE